MQVIIHVELTVEEYVEQEYHRQVRRHLEYTVSGRKQKASYFIGREDGNLRAVKANALDLFDRITAGVSFLDGEVEERVQIRQEVVPRDGAQRLAAVATVTVEPLLNVGGRNLRNACLAECFGKFPEAIIDCAKMLLAAVHLRLGLLVFWEKGVDGAPV